MKKKVSGVSSLFCFLAAILSALALFGPGDTEMGNGIFAAALSALSVPPAQFLGASCACGGFFLLYRRYLTEGARPGEIALSIVYTLFLCASRLAVSADRIGRYLSVRGNILALLMFAAGAWLFVLALLRAGRALWDRPAEPRGEAPVSFLKRAAGILLCWLPYYAACFPGSVEFDMGRELLPFFGKAPFSSKMPFFVEWLFAGWIRLFDRLGSPLLGVALYSALHMLCACALFAASVYWMEKRGVSRRAANAAAGVYALVPVFPLYALNICKDNLFAMSVFLVLLLMARAFAQPDAFPARPRHYVLIGLALALVGLTRNVGLYLAPLLALPFFLMSRRWKGIFACGACAVALLCAYNFALLPAIGVAPSDTAENMSIMLQQTARYARDYGQDAKDWEKEAIDQVIQYDQAARLYSPGLSDPVKDSARMPVSRQAKRAYWRAWLSQMRRHPDAYLEAALHMTTGYLSPSEKSRDRRSVVVGITGSAQDALNDLELNVRNVFPGLVKKLRAAIRAVEDMPVAGLVFRAGTYMWLLLFLFYGAWSRGRRRVCAALIPVLALAAGCLFSPANGYFRYMLPAVYAAPLLWLMCVEMDRPRARASGAEEQTTDGTFSPD